MRTKKINSSPPNEYKQYQQATQKEYSDLDENTYKTTRLRVSFCKITLHFIHNNVVMFLY